mgnify:CR=1 FL=1
MALKFNNTEITRVYFNGTEKMALQFNGTGYFGKRFSLTQSNSTGVSITVKRTSSPNQCAATGSVGTGNMIYYGDVITITCNANSGYINPKLYVNTGSGITVRTSPYTFTVTGDVTFYGEAEEDWLTIWSGSKIIDSMVDFEVPGLESYDGDVQLTAVITFGTWTYDQKTGQYLGYTTYDRSINRKTLPATIVGSYGYITFTREKGKITFTAKADAGSLKGYYLYDTPISTEFTEVRVKK